MIESDLNVGHVEGGCLCGAIRYRIRTVFDVVYCHCRACRRRTGAPVALSVVVPKDAFDLLEGRPSSFRSSDMRKSHFCGTCGTPLYFVEDRGPYVSVSHGSLDDPKRVEPKRINGLPGNYRGFASTMTCHPSRMVGFLTPIVANCAVHQLQTMNHSLAAIHTFSVGTSFACRITSSER